MFWFSFLSLTLILSHFVSAGVIDQDYRGNVGVILFNFGAEEFKGNQTYQNVTTRARHTFQPFFNMIMFENFFNMIIQNESVGS